MPQMTLTQTRVIDPVLTTIAQAMPDTAGFVGKLLFPTVSVNQRGGKIIQFGKEAYQIYTNLQRAPGTNTKRVQFGYSSSPYSLDDYSLEGLVPVELLQEARAVPGIDLASQAVRTVQSIVEIRLEKQQADLATNAANYGASSKVTLSGTSQWSDYSGTSAPSKDINTGREAIRAQTGRYPNLAIIPAAVMSALMQHPAIIDRIKYTGRDSITTDMLATLWNIPRVVVAQGVYYDDAGVQKDMWGKSVILTYSELSSIATVGLPSYGYTYRLSGYPIVEPPYLERNPKSWIYPVTDVVTPVLTSSIAGYIIINAVA